MEMSVSILVGLTIVVKNAGRKIANFNRRCFLLLVFSYRFQIRKMYTRPPETWLGNPSLGIFN